MECVALRPSHISSMFQTELHSSSPVFGDEMQNLSSRRRCSFSKSPESGNNSPNMSPISSPSRKNGANHSDNLFTSSQGMQWANFLYIFTWTFWFKFTPVQHEDCYYNRKNLNLDFYGLTRQPRQPHSTTFNSVILLCMLIWFLYFYLTESKPLFILGLVVNVSHLFIFWM